jgi:uncharacterized lipoprotein YbaY
VANLFVAGRMDLMTLGRWAVAVSLSMSGCASRTPEVTGTVTFDEPAGLPATAVLEVTLQDVSRADALAQTIGVTRVVAPKTSPVPFAIAYDPAAIVDSHEYAVRARILDGDRLLFTTDTRRGVLTRGHGNTTALTLTKVPQPTAVPPPLVKGFFVVADDGPWFTPCGQSDRLRVSSGSDFAALEASYLAARRATADPLLTRVEGEEHDGTFAVRRFVSIAVDQTCESQ